MNCFNIFNLIEFLQLQQKKIHYHSLASNTQQDPIYSPMCVSFLFFFLLTSFSVLVSCLRMSIIQGSSLIPLLNPRDTQFYTYDLYIFISHLDLFPKLHFHHSNCPLDTWSLLFQHYLKLNNFIAKFIISFPSSLHPLWLLLLSFLLRHHSPGNLSSICFHHHDSSFSPISYISSVIKIFQLFLHNFSPPTMPGNEDSNWIIYPLSPEYTTTSLAQGIRR